MRRAKIFNARDRRESVSRLQKRSDLMIWTTPDHIESMGDRVRLTADFLDRRSGSPMYVAAFALGWLGTTRPSSTSNRRRSD